MMTTVSFNVDDSQISIEKTKKTGETKKRKPMHEV